MLNKYLHIISFDIPYPANYGGVIDVFHKIRLLHQSGIKIILHCFQYRGKEKSIELEKYCHKVYYYQRNTGICSNISITPYIVKSRENKKLIDNLLLDDFPILFEGKHTCYYIGDKRLKNRLKIYRACNIEYDYYMGLSKAEKNSWKKIFFFIEAQKLKKFQYKLKNASVLLPLSTKDKSSLEEIFLEKKIIYIPAFHPNDTFNIRSDIESKKHILFHGKLSVPENEAAANHLIRIFEKHEDLHLTIAGLHPTESLKELCSKKSNVDLIENPSEENLLSLIQHASVHLLYTSQATGIKLKLLYVLFNGKHCVCNNEMIEGTGLEKLCHIANTSEEIVSTCRTLLQKPFTEQDKQNRIDLMSTKYDNQEGIKKILKILE